MVSGGRRDNLFKGLWLEGPRVLRKSKGDRMVAAGTKGDGRDELRESCTDP